MLNLFIKIYLSKFEIVKSLRIFAAPYESCKGKKKVHWHNGNR